MTVFGIGGCMALLLVGFGLRDSIVDIAKLQYHELQLYDANIILNTSASKQEQNNVEQELYWNDQVDAERQKNADFTDTYANASQVVIVRK